jgi:hypothetical protein
MRIASASVTAGLLGAAALLVLTPSAGAEPTEPTPDPDPAVAVQAAAPEGVPHLPSPDNLPPGASTTPVVPESRGLAYLRDLWHAVQTQEVSGADALLLLTQRPMDPGAAPPGMPLTPAPPPSAPAPAAPPAP